MILALSGAVCALSNISIGASVVRDRTDTCPACVHSSAMAHASSLRSFFTPVKLRGSTFGHGDRRVFYRQARGYMPTFEGLTAEGLSLRRRSLTLKCSFR